MCSGHLHGAIVRKRCHSKCSSGHLHGAGLADARLIVTVDVGAHGQLALLLLVAEDLLDVLRVLERVATPPDRA